MKGTLGHLLVLLVSIPCAGCTCLKSPSPSRSCREAVRLPVRSAPIEAPSTVPPIVPPDVVVDEDEDEQGYWPILSNDAFHAGTSPPEHMFVRAKEILLQHGISEFYVECGHGLCWLAVREEDVDTAIRLLSASPTLAPFSGRAVEVVEEMDSRVLRSKSQQVADRAASVLTARGIESMIEKNEGTSEVWVDRKYREAAMRLLRSDASLRPYAARTAYGRDQSARPSAVQAPR